VLGVKAKQSQSAALVLNISEFLTHKITNL
jgi:hypothetical protein